MAIVLAAFTLTFPLIGGSINAFATKGDRGTDQSVYQGQYGKTGYGDETF